MPAPVIPNGIMPSIKRLLVPDEKSRILRQSLTIFQSYASHSRWNCKIGYGAATPESKARILGDCEADP